MRRALAALLLVLLMVNMAISASAATAVSDSRLNASVATDGTCIVNLELHFRLDAPDKSLSFPIPANAKNVTVNGSTAWTYTDGAVRHVKLGGIVGNTAGNFTVYLQYTVPNTVDYDEQEKLMLTLPLLSGFAHSVEKFSFTITFPNRIYIYFFQFKSTSFNINIRFKCRHRIIRYISFQSTSNTISYFNCITITF